MIVFCNGDGHSLFNNSLSVGLSVTKSHPNKMAEDPRRTCSESYKII